MNTAAKIAVLVTWFLVGSVLIGLTLEQPYSFILSLIHGATISNVAFHWVILPILERRDQREIW